ncbi:MAG TPA: hypothetical protein GXZ90_01965 [Clostridiales bacterium]|nr:hypothetical protein [Clostridiales bacterium]
MSYKEVKQQYPFATIKIVANNQKEIKRYKKQGYIKVSDYIIDNWGCDLDNCYMIY